MKLACLATVVVLFMYQIWKGCCAPSWNNGPISFGNRMDRLFPGPSRRTTSTKSKSGPAPGSWIYIMGHPGSKRSDPQMEPLTDLIEAEMSERSPAWNDKVHTMRLLNDFLQFMRTKGLGHSYSGTTTNDLDVKTSKEFTTD